MEMTMTNPEMTYHTNGHIYTITHRNTYGILHNNMGPAHIQYYDNGQKEYEQYWVDSNYHNDKGPAIIKYFKNGQKELEEYWVDSNYHNDKGPALIQYSPNGQKSYEGYYKDGNLHNLTGPAFIKYYKNGKKEYETYYVEDKRVDGNKLIQELGINTDYTLWSDEEKDMFSFHLASLYA